MRSFQRLLGALLAGLALLPTAVLAQNEDPADWPGRVGRIVEVQGSASQLDLTENTWIAAVPNRPLTGGDHIVTDPGARLELRIGSSTVRLDGRTDLLLARLDDQAIVLQLNRGSLALKVVSQVVLPQIEVVTLEGRFRPRQIGHYRIDQREDGTEATSWRGELQFDGRDSTLGIPAGRRAELWLQGPAQTTHYTWRDVERDAFADWVAYDDTFDDRSISARYVSPEMTGWEDLDRYGSWQNHPEYGGVWIPTAVPVGWAPYRSGHWAWIAPWGWTWVDDARWGFAPFHYGRWVFWGQRWCWVPEHRSVRPRYSPALVAWVSVGSGFANGRGPAVGWVPLGPREPYHRRPPTQGPGLAGSPMNQLVAGAVTAVPAEAFGHRRAVQPGTGGGLPAATQWRSVAVPPAPPGIVGSGQRAPAVPTAPRSVLPAAPSGAIPTAPRAAVPTEPRAAVPTEPRAAVPTAPRAAVPTAPRAAVPAAPESAVPTAPPAAVPTTPGQRAVPGLRHERPEAPVRPTEEPRQAPERGHRAPAVPAAPPAAVTVPTPAPPAAVPTVRAPPPAAPAARTPPQPAPPPAAHAPPAPAPRATPEAREQEGHRRAAPEQRQDKDEKRERQNAR